MNRRGNAIAYLHKQKAFAFLINTVTRYRQKGEEFGGNGT